MLTKSLYKLGQRCQKALYLNIHTPELAKQSSSFELKLKEEGIGVGKYARTLYPVGILIETLDPYDAILETSKKITEGALTIFEAGFCFEDVFIRVDILHRTSIDNPWKLYEVKATTYNNVDEIEKEEYRNDIAIQVWVLQKCGLQVDGAYLMHLNSSIVFPNLDSLFVSKNYWTEIAPKLIEIPNLLNKLTKTIESTIVPEISIGTYCDKSHECSFKDFCWKHIPEPSVFDIPNCRTKWNYYKQGRFSVDQLNKSDFKSESHLRVLKCYKENKPFFDKSKAAVLLQEWQYPLSYFDIEAVAYPIPRYPNTRPYQNLPFQFSCHIKRNESSELEHYEFLHEDESDPRRSFIEKTLEIIPKTGSIVVYHKTYEITKIKELARDFPEYSQSINCIILRIVDLKDVITKTLYYPEFLGSYSIKTVARVLLGSQADYSNLEISDGVSAMMNYQQMITGQSPLIKSALLQYCRQDTLLMVHLYHWLLKNSEQCVIQ